MVRAIVLYETALGVGIATGPLLGGVLGNLSWRGPFFGVSALMAVSLVATILLLPPTPTPARKERITEPIKALIESREAVDAESLRDPDVPLDELVAATAAS